MKIERNKRKKEEKKNPSKHISKFCWKKKKKNAPNVHNVFIFEVAFKEKMNKIMIITTKKKGENKNT